MTELFQNTGSFIEGTIRSEVLKGTSGGDHIEGKGGDDTLDGGAGHDQLLGGAGNDTYYVDTFYDLVIEAANGGIDTVIASSDFSAGFHIEYLLAAPGTANIRLWGANTATSIAGNDGANVLSGGNGDDRLFGAGGNDKLIGGLGSDMLIGGTGRDIFVFDKKPASNNIDTIADFSALDDTIHLSKKVFSKIGKKGALSKKAFWTGAAALDADDRVGYDPKSGKLFYDPDGAGKQDASVIAILEKNLKGISAKDFDII